MNKITKRGCVSWFRSQNGATIILLHGYGANRTELIRHTEILARHGYGVLIYDLRAHGQSGGKQFALKNTRRKW